MTQTIQYTLVSFLLSLALFLFNPATTYAQPQCCCSAGCVGFGFGDCDSWCVVIGQTNAGSTTPYADPATCMAACVLPVELEYFNTFSSKEGVMIDWRTAAEIDNEGFNVQRMSGIKMQWETIGYVAGQGTTSRTHEYSFLDETPPPGINYYRLMQVDFSGLTSYSEVESVHRGEEKTVYVWPTLAKDHVFMRVDDFEEYEVRVIDMMGQVVLTENVVNSYINVQNLSEGHYIINIYADGKEYTERFVKIR